jgi:ketosteroid isomerase-like protein
MQIARGVIVAGVVMLCACARPVPKVATATAADVAAVKQIVATFDSCARTGALDVFVSHVDDDVVALMPDQPALVGKAAVRESYRNLYGTFNFDMHHAPIDVHSVGDLVIVRGGASGTLTAKAGGPPMPFDNKFLMIFRRQADGSLKVWRVAANTNAPAAPPPATKRG